ncbi:MAG: cysteine--tRNA ligase, partial [Betaproteobacteria bacterium]|nr:cysteine--tRNA ligase [Betaproteobacteria bacterium]
VRFFVARAHYRSPLNYSDQHLDDARHGLTRLYTALKGVLQEDPAAPDWNEPHARRLREAMNDDFNTPEAVAVLFDLANEVNRSGPKALGRQLRALGGVLGLLQRDTAAFLQGRPPVGAAEAGAASAISEAEIDALIAERQAARKIRDFKRADQVRVELLAKGVVLEDSPQGTTWRRA